MFSFQIPHRVHQSIGWSLVVVIVFLSLVPSPPIPTVTGNYDDKIVHSFTYALLMGWFAVGASKSAWTKIGCYAFALGCVLECCQALLPYRMASLGDIAANGLGILIGAIAAVVLTTGSRSLRRAK